VLTENATHLLDRGWNFCTSQSMWIYTLNEAVLSHETVEKTKHLKFVNLVTLLERGFKPAVGGKWKKGSLFVDARALGMEHGKFMALLRQRQREHWVARQEKEEA